MKKKFRLALIIVLLCSFFGCSLSEQPSQSSIGKEQAEEVLRCFDEEDTEALKSLFCEEVQDTHDINKEIEEAMELFEGKTVSHDKILIGGGEAVDDGELTDSHIGYSIDSIQNGNGKTYRIVTHSYLVYDKGPQYIGITYLKVIDEETGETVRIGEYVY